MPGIWERAYEDTYKIESSDYPFWLLSSRSMQFAWGANAGIPMIKEVADNIAGHGGVIINTGWAHEIGIADGGQIEIRSPIGVTTGRAVLRQGICPDTLLMIGQFGLVAMLPNTTRAMAREVSVWYSMTESGMPGKIFAQQWGGIGWV